MKVSKKIKAALFITTILMVGLVGCKKKTEYATPKEDIALTFPIEAENAKKNPQFAQSSGPYAIFHTTAGDITVVLYPDQAPKAVENFIGLVGEGFYDESLFRYVVKNAIVQGGVSKDGEEKSFFGEAFADEFSDDLHHFHGALAMANNGMDSNESQFYFIASQEIPENEKVIPANLYMNELVRKETIGLNEKDTETALSEEELQAFETQLNEKIQNISKEGGIPKENLERYQKAVDVYMKEGGAFHLDYKNTVFGQVIKGLNVVDGMSQVIVGTDRKPKEDISITSIEIVDHLE